MRNSIQTARRAVKTTLEALVCRTCPGYRAYLRLKHHAAVPEARPSAQWQNSTLKTPFEWEQARAQIRRLGLIEHGDAPKNWDALAALTTILAYTTPSSAVLDAGAEFYSPILPCLFLYGYRNLIGINLEFRKPVRRGPICYEPGDLTKTRFAAESFDAIACLSVIEHGVNLDSYFSEMSRILRPNGILITSTDYWPQAINTGAAIAYGSPVKIFTQQEIGSALQLSQQYGFALTGPVDLTAHEKTVNWKRFGLEFTFVNFCLCKKTCPAPKIEH